MGRQGPHGDDAVRANIFLAFGSFSAITSLHSLSHPRGVDPHPINPIAERLFRV